MALTDIKFYSYGINPEQLRHAHDSDAGWDVINASDNTITIEPHQTVKIPLGFGMSTPSDCAMLLTARSSTGSKGLQLGTIPIDEGYTGEINAIVTNLRETPFVIEPKERFAQFIIVPVIKDLNFIVTDVNTVQTDRGSNGFGSSGTN